MALRLPPPQLSVAELLRRSASRRRGSVAGAEHALGTLYCTPAYGDFHCTVDDRLVEHREAVVASRVLAAQSTHHSPLFAGAAGWTRAELLMLAIHECADCLSEETCREAVGFAQVRGSKSVCAPVCMCLSR